MPKITRRPDSAYWFAWVTDPRTGKRKRVSTHETNKRLAQSVADARERRAFDPARSTEGPAVTLEVAARDFVEQRAALKAAATREFYEKKLGVVANYFGPTREIATIDAAAIDKFTSDQLTRGAEKSTIGKYLTALRQVLKLARRQGKYPYALDDVMPERWPGKSKPRKRWCQPEEVWAIIRELPTYRGAVVAFHVATGSNLGECLRVRREDVASDRSQVFLRGTKRETRERMAPVFPWGAPFLAYALQHGNKKRGEPLFRDWYKAMRWDLKRVCEKLEIEGVSSNDLRRTYSKWLRLRGVAPNLIGPAMGHAPGSKMVEQHYGQVTSDELRALIDLQLAGAKQ